MWQTKFRALSREEQKNISGRCAKPPSRPKAIAKSTKTRSTPRKHPKPEYSEGSHGQAEWKLAAQNGPDEYGKSNAHDDGYAQNAGSNADDDGYGQNDESNADNDIQDNSNSSNYSNCLNYSNCNTQTADSNDYYDFDGHGYGQDADHYSNCLNDDQNADSNDYYDLDGHGYGQDADHYSNLNYDQNADSYELDGYGQGGEDDADSDTEGEAK